MANGYYTNPNTIQYHLLLSIIRTAREWLSGQGGADYAALQELISTVGFNDDTL